MSQPGTRMSDGLWNVLWNLGLLLGLVGVPAMIGYFTGTSIEGASKPPVVPWRFLFCALGAIVGCFAAWRMLAARPSRPRQ